MKIEQLLSNKFVDDHHAVASPALRLAYEACLFAHSNGRALPAEAVLPMLESAFAVPMLARCSHPFKRSVYRLAPAVAGDLGGDLFECYVVPVSGLVALAAGLEERFAECRRLRNSAAKTAQKVRTAPVRPTKPQTERAAAPVVDSARRIVASLGVRDAVIVGGNRNAEAERSLGEAFGCSFMWVGTDKYDTCRTIAAPIERADLIISAVNFSRHRTTNYLNDLSRRGIAPLVRLTRGYGVASVAEAITSQLGPR